MRQVSALERLLENLEDPDIWMAHKYTSPPVGNGGKSRISVLKLTRAGLETTATSNKEKSTLLARTFFPPGHLKNPHYPLYT